MLKLKSRSLLILMAMIVLMLIPISFAADSTDASVAALDDAAEVGSAPAIDSVAIEDSQSAIDDDKVAASNDDVISSDSNEAKLGLNDTDINRLIDESPDGNVNLGDGETYYIINPITINKKVNLTGTGVTFIGNGSTMPDGMLVFTNLGNHSTISGITFQNNDSADNWKYKYNGKEVYNAKKGTWDSEKTAVGIAITLNSAANNILIDNCVFNNWYNVGVSLNSVNYATVRNSRFYGGSATYINNLPDGPKDRGTYHISAMSSKYTVVYNCEFHGPVCDGVSVAGNSLNSNITGNTFDGNAYAIYFGGKSTEGTTIEGNTFTNCGWFESAVYNETGDTGKTVNFQDLPVISVQKASEMFVIKNNIFNARTANILIAAMEGSVAHGDPSPIGNITITDNTVNPIDASVYMPSVTLVEITTKNAQIAPIGDIVIANNNLNGAKSAAYWIEAWGDREGNVTVPQAPLISTVIYADPIVNGVLNGVLKDVNGIAIEGKTISYTMKDASGTALTGKNGVFTIENVTSDIKLVFAATGAFNGCELNIAVPAPVTQVATTITASAITLKAGNSGTFKVTLKDANGNNLNGVVAVIIDGVVKNVNVKNGVGTLTVKYTSSGVHNVVASYAGSSTTKSTFKTSKITVVKKATTFTAPKVKAKVKKATKVQITLKSEGKAVSGKKISITVKGKTFSGTTNSKGVATIKVKVAKKGTFKYTAKFAGDGAYKAFSKTAKIIVK